MLAATKRSEERDKTTLTIDIDEVIPVTPKMIRDASHANRTKKRNQSRPRKILRRAASGWR
jgi:deferrochelatase/peroxidase EfeB